MEQHPVPRNISSFQFHLIGDMTVRQFAYLAGGVFTGYILFRIIPGPKVISITLAVGCGLIGAAFAFVPIQERPLDKWIIAFIRSILSPTQYVWHKASNIPEILTRPVAVQKKPSEHEQAHKDAKDKLHAYLQTLPAQPHQNLNKMEKLYINQTMSLFNTTYGFSSTPAVPAFTLAPVEHTPVQDAATTSSVAPTFQAQPAPPSLATLQPQSVTAAQPPQVPSVQSAQAPISSNSLPAEEPLHPPIQTAVISPVKPVMVKPVQIQPNPVQLQPSVEPQPSIAPVPTKESKEEDPQSELQKQLDELARQKEQLMKELQGLKSELTQMNKPEIVQPAAMAEPKKTSTVHAVSSQQAAEEIGMANLPHTPNIIVGIVKDSQRKILPNIIITIKDTKNMPLRAMKTNKLGQFATATQLGNGTYRLELEDPMKRFIFDIVELTLNGKICLPVEIIAKGEKEIMREKLSKELFGTSNGMM